MQEAHSRISVFAFTILSCLSAVFAQSGKWSYLPDTADVIAREECGFGQAGGKFYLFGGRDLSAVQEYNPSTRTWKNLGKAPKVINHFQAHSHSGLIYIIGAFDEGNAGWPNERPIPNIYIYDPLSDTWVTGPSIPLARRRGSAGLVEYKNKLYIVLGNKLGHMGPGAPWLDEFDPSTNIWTPLPDAPRFRDHFQASVSNGKIYAIGGRQSIDRNANFAGLEKVDVFDLESKTWSTLPSPASDMKSPRSGSIVAALGNEIIVAGGSNPTAFPTGAYNLTDAFNTVENTWRSLAPMNRGRQVTGGFINNSGLYVVSGSGGRDGTPKLKSMEVFFLGDSMPVIGDPLVAGKLTHASPVFNFGIVQSGQTSTQEISLQHGSGNQGILVSAFKIVGDSSFKVNATIVGPYLVRPGERTQVSISFASKGAIPAESHLEVTLAVPPGVVFKLPLEANRTGSPIRAFHHTPSGAKGYPARVWESSWLFRSKASDAPNAAREAGEYRNALGRTP